MQIIVVEELPPKLFCNILVSLESRKFMNYLEPVLSLFITLERANRLRFMFDPSRRRNPSYYVLLTPSLPAKSTRLSYDCLYELPLFVQLDVILILNKVCERDDASFNLVSATFLASSPYSISLRTYSGSWTLFSDKRLI